MILPVKDYEGVKLIAIAYFSSVILAITCALFTCNEQKFFDDTAKSMCDGLCPGKDCVCVKGSDEIWYFNELISN